MVLFLQRTLALYFTVWIYYKNDAYVSLVSS